MKDVFLHAGELAFGTEPTRISTILGSCIAVCIWDKELKMGGMCHYYLPYSNNDQQNPNKYGEFAIPNLLKEFKNKNSKQQNLVAKIVGGGRVIDSFSKEMPDVGNSNIAIARELLKKFNIPILKESVGGSYGKKIRFYTDSGQVELKQVEKNSNIENTAEILKPTAVKTTPQPTQAQVSKGKIQIMIVDDSKTVRTLLKKMIAERQDMEVLHEAGSADEARKLMAQKAPDVITLDINMPGIDGVTFLKEYIKKTPIPTIMISALNYSDSGPVFDAIESGAFDYIKKPSLEELQSTAAELYEKILAAHKSVYAHKAAQSVAHGQQNINNSNLGNFLIAIGASTGGTSAIKDVLVDLPENIPPIIITQHIPPVFSKAFADRLNQICPFEVKEASDGDEIRPGLVLVAPGGKHLKVEEKSGKLLVKITEDPPVNRFRPSVDYMFKSIPAKLNRKICAVILTGMGGDGAQGLKYLLDNGAYTIAQDEATSVVYGMPKVARDIGAAKEVIPLHGIATKIASYVNKS